ncbi:MAG: biotin--[acetyl-CoA-carboxylase] ligase [Bacteroidota bacterium]|nr:biotin--[acetyl-CoA-carboxylase] ligase [Bacteroidota bacterium]
MPQPSATKPLGSPFVEMQSVDSTNNYARQQLHAGLAQHGMAFFAHEQVAGKGQRNKVWMTEKGKNILLSVVVKPLPLQLAQQFQLSACVAVAVHDFFMKYAGEDSKIKWPNDLYWQDRKAGGILVESVVGSRETGPGIWEWSIVGIGININQVVFDPEIKNPVSLKQITGKYFDTVELAKELCTIVDKRFTELIEEGFENIYNSYLTHLYKRKAIVKLKKGSAVFEALIKDVSPAGMLMTQHAISEEFNFGEIEWVV